MNWQERIIVDPEILVGKPVIKGTRRVYHRLAGPGLDGGRNFAQLSRNHAWRYSGLFAICQRGVAHREGISTGSRV